MYLQIWNQAPVEEFRLHFDDIKILFRPFRFLVNKASVAIYSSVLFSFLLPF